MTPNLRQGFSLRRGVGEGQGQVFFFCFSSLMQKAALVLFSHDPARYWL